MKIAIPVERGKLCTHFGHCPQFTIITAENGVIAGQEVLTPPPHAPGVIPNWLAAQGCTDIIVGNMGKAAQAIVRERGMNVIFGAPAETPEALTELYLRGALVSVGGGGCCSHDHEAHHAHGHEHEHKHDHCQGQGCGRH